MKRGLIASVKAGTIIAYAYEAAQRRTHRTCPTLSGSTAAHCRTAHAACQKRDLR